ncbi:sigma factor-like helix-turn-helix DNA-binding protein [Mycoplasmopsis synoviae]|uniref:sigma factor-like helix-turn-helix DNA-binding protein n=1 Tax=Mycoplasmopsis synoviae TaxID=2109 RepID=UPI000CA3A578|nr:sigma factor-like helix-turn-helix DNA-binding protein [Mycoplasmopsis synoviae]AKJ21076.1 hypothetical protein MSHv_06160 [Mycoplasmopsis synoviae]AQU48413.1 hypothetical protein ADF19_06160 [Mycoplasmopsis synoviae]AWL83980.1 hypothetical protein MSH_00800 [Mycoplasmopsis synoviae]QLE13709.1 hypothetical protein DEH79_00795 [Mycoplasmopsis synoviae]UZF64470.1 hypothetical protein N0B76_00810 [Mycoplasmopsis synoviae]
MSKKNFEDLNLYLMLFDKYSFLLTQNQKQIFQLYFHEDLSYSEIAKILVTSRTNVYDSINKTLRKLIKLEEKFKKEY